ncbi:deaminase [Burkholderia sp. PAMC 28687]|uniref:Pyrimidine deaminase n=1 Tax=Caballeronia sordidicola TaxID=196367 RepID=A0A242MCJ6_CABSO|nr:MULTISPECIES: PP0621 family protein [Burkholderiaceae]AMM14865.1 deaminase [Burkholderia sp. PAMC 28687]OTP69016.1 Pyrimidine deaminase [Caballeronia sordidicola]
MRQIILLIFVFFASQWLFKKLKRAQAAAGGAQAGAGGNGAGNGTGSARASRGPSASSAPQLPDALVRCAECGVHTPSSDAVVAAGHRFCSVGHAQRHAARPTGRDAR